MCECYSMLISTGTQLLVKVEGYVGKKIVKVTLCSEEKEGMPMKTGIVSM